MSFKQYKAFQGSKKKGRKAAYESREKHRANLEEVARLAERMGLKKIVNKIVVRP
jgi:hypothetical protein